MDYAKLLREKILPQVQKPARYLGQEWNQITKALDQVRTRVVLAFPDVYEVGISYLGYQILYELLNAQPDIYAERAYSPWPDAEALLRMHQIPLTSVESSTPLDQFHFLGITLQHEMSYTNVLNILSLAQIPLDAGQRNDAQPLVIGGGPCASNPEPLAQAFDLIVLGDGEKVFLEVIRAEAQMRTAPRALKLKTLSRIPGVYVPGFYQPLYTPEGRIERIENLEDAPYPVQRRIEEPLPFPEKPLVPYLSGIHDRVTVELFRGCTRGCRFCQAGMITRPVRERDPQAVLGQMLAALQASGYEEISVTSLSSGDYSQLLPWVNTLMRELAPTRVALSFPSLRLDSFRRELAEAVRQVRKTGLTFAPEAGSQRLRQVINKDLDEGEMLKHAGQVFGEGWDLIKLYFMIGLPTETPADITAVSEMVKQILATGRAGGSRRRGRVNLSINLFVPKAHTPFQWEPQLSRQEAQERFRQLERELPRAVGFAFGKRQHEDLDRAYLEAILARGDRRLWPALVRAWELGCRFDGWGDQFQFPLWEQALREQGLDPAGYALRRRDLGEVLPWSHLDMGVDPEFLKTEQQRALAGELTVDCRNGCQGCGVADPNACPPALANPLPMPAPAGALKVPQPEREKVRYRLRYAKTGDLRFVGHLDLVNAFRRAARRADLPLHYSVGFHPQPSLAFGPPLPLGQIGLAEWLDLGLDSWLDPQEILRRWNAQLPNGLHLDACREIPLSTPALAKQIQAGEYGLTFPDDEPLKRGVEKRIAELQQATTLPGRQWSKQGMVSVDLKSAVVRLEMNPPAGGPLQVTLVHNAAAVDHCAKPSTLVEYLCQDQIPTWQVQVVRKMSGVLYQGEIQAP